MSKNVFVPPPARDPFTPKTRVNIKADVIKVDQATGVVTLAIESNPLPRELQQAMAKHFPHCFNEIEEMCGKELLLSCFTTEGTLDDERV